MRRLVTALLPSSMLAALALAGSAGAQGVVLPLPPQDQAAITKQLGAGVVGNALPSQPVGDPATYFPLQAPAVSDAGEGVIVVTTPPNPFVLKGMKPGETRSFAQTVSVNYLDDPTRQDYSGSLIGTYTFVGTYQVTVPAGSYAADRFRLAYEGKVGPAYTQDTAYYFFAPGTGVVAMISQEDVEAFWIIHIDTSIGKVLSAN